jgi:hypothetical protein
MNTASATAQILIAIIPIVGIVMGSTVVFFYLLFNYRKKVLLIRQGIHTDGTFDFDTFSLLAGLLNLCIGLVLSLFFLIKEGWSYGLLGGLIPFSIGISLVAFFYLRKKSSGRR